MAVFYCQDERARSFGGSFAAGFSRLHRLIRVCASFQQRANSFSSSLARGEKERCEARVGKGRSEICAGLEQQFDDWPVAFRGGPHQRRLPALFFGINL